MLALHSRHTFVRPDFPRVAVDGPRPLTVTRTASTAPDEDIFWTPRTGTPVEEPAPVVSTEVTNLLNLIDGFLADFATSQEELNAQAAVEASDPLAIRRKPCPTQDMTRSSQASKREASDFFDYPSPLKIRRHGRRPTLVRSPRMARQMSTPDVTAFPSPLKIRQKEQAPGAIVRSVRAAKRRSMARKSVGALNAEWKGVNSVATPKGAARGARRMTIAHSKAFDVNTPPVPRFSELFDHFRRRNSEFEVS